MEVTPLGGGQDIGKSCIVVTLGSKRIMFDCGMHMGYEDMRRFPDFKAIVTSPDRLTDAIDCVVITHFHLDHIGALPYLTETRGYQGPVFMTHPTRAVGASQLEDYRHVMVDRMGYLNFFSREDIDACMDRVTVIGLEETVWVDDELRITPYYAGHVLGAVIVHAECARAPPSCQVRAHRLAAPAGAPAARSCTRATSTRRPTATSARRASAGWRPTC